MRVLAIDTASDAATVAVAEDNVLIGESILNHKKTHSQKIMVMIERLMSDLEIEASDIDYFAAAVGPGSFTGLRIGVATAKALAHSCYKPVVGVSTLEGLAYNLPCTEDVIAPIMDARRNNVFNAAYRFSGGALETVVEPNVCGAEECFARLSDYNVIFTGDGVNVHKDRIGELFSRQARLAPVSHRMSRASSVAMCAFDKIARGEITPYNELAPVYLRLSQAERELQERKKK